MSRIGEKILLARLKNKDKNAFLKAYDLYSGTIYQFILFKVGNSEDAKDLTSAVFLKSWQYALQQNAIEEKTVKALLYKIARNTVIDFYRKNKAQTQISLDDPGNEIDIADDTQDILKNLQTASDMSLVEKALLELKDDYRDVIIMRYIQEMSATEISDIIGKPKGGTRVLIFRALKALKEIIKKKDQIKND